MIDSSRGDGGPPAGGRLVTAGFLKSRRFLRALLPGLGGFLTIALLAEVGDLLQTLTVIAPFGASAVLVFAAPASPFAQPRNVIGGHLFCAIVGVVVFALFGQSPISMGLAVGL